MALISAGLIIQYFFFLNEFLFHGLTLIALEKKDIKLNPSL